MKKADKKTIEMLKPIWVGVRDAQEKYWEDIKILEEYAQKITGVDIEVFHCDGEACGLGNYARTMKLIQDEELK